MCVCVCVCACVYDDGTTQHHSDPEIARDCPRSPGCVIRSLQMHTPRVLRTGYSRLKVFAG